MRSTLLAVGGFLVVVFLLTYRSGTGARGDTGKPKTSSDPQIEAKKKQLSSEQYAVTQQCGTEPPFHNQYWDNHADGIYVDVVSGEPLFSSRDKYDSGTGWPSFSAPLEKANIVDKSDSSLMMTRVEVRSKGGDSHLGHLFDDGPSPTGQRYCINSAALRFIPAERLTIEGYGQYAKDFPKVKQLPAPKPAAAAPAKPTK